MYWEITDKGDPDALALVDGVTELIKGRSGFGKPHYSRQQPGTRFFTRNGQNLVFITPDKLAVWVTFRPTPGKAVRPDKRDAWECSMFRNEGPILSSLLIKEAVELSCAIWGKIPSDGLITFIRPEKTTYKRSPKSLPGACYRHAGWAETRPSSDGKPCLYISEPAIVPAVTEWNFAGTRGGILRAEIERNNTMPKPVLKIAEPHEPYNTKEDLLELAQEYKEIQQRIEKDNFALSRLAQEAAKKYDLKEFAKLTGENYNNLKQLSYIAGRYEEYTKYTLTFRHYMVAAKSDSRLEWLEKAEKNGWSAARLHREMNPPKEKPKSKLVITPVTSTTEINQAGEVAYIQQSKEPEIYRPSYDDIFDSLNTWAATEDGVKFLMEHGKNIFTMLKALWNEERTIVPVGDHFEMRTIVTPRDGAQEPTKDGPSD